MRSLQRTCLERAPLPSFLENINFSRIYCIGTTYQSQTGVGIWQTNPKYRDSLKNMITKNHQIEIYMEKHKNT